MSQRNVDQIIGYTIASAVGIGGLAGWYQAKSAPSLIAGLASGALLAVGTSRTAADPSNVGITVVMSSVLIGLMGHKAWSHNWQLNPAVIISGLSLIMLGRFAPRLLK